MIIFTSGVYCALAEMGITMRDRTLINTNTIFVINITYLTRDNIMN